MNFDNPSGKQSMSSRSESDFSSRPAFLLKPQKISISIVASDGLFIIFYVTSAFYASIYYRILVLPFRYWQTRWIAMV